MKKMMLLILFCGVVFFCITGCNVFRENSETYSFKGKIIECNQNSMIVEPNIGEEELKTSDRFNIGFINDFNTCSVGDKVKINYSGMINESYPAQINTTGIEIIK